MNKVTLALAIPLACGLLSVASGETYTPGDPTNQDFAGFAEPFLANHCLDCHGAPMGFPLHIRGLLWQESITTTSLVISWAFQRMRWNA